VRKGETREEKKIRKAAVKVGRKEARRHKKSLKEAFKKEEVSQNCILVSNSTPINASISKLS
jgi:protein LTV1